MFALGFWRDATERAVKTAAQAVVAFFGVSAAFDAVNADWASAGSVALGGAILSYLFSIVSAPLGSENNKGTPAVF